MALAILYGGLAVPIQTLDDGLGAALAPEEEAAGAAVAPPVVASSGGGGGGGSSFFLTSYSALLAPPPHVAPARFVTLPVAPAEPALRPVTVGRLAFEVAKRAAALAAKLLAVESAIVYVERKAHPRDKKVVRDAVQAKRDFDAVAAQIARLRRYT